MDYAVLYAVTQFSHKGKRGIREKKAQGRKKGEKSLQSRAAKMRFRFHAPNDSWRRNRRVT